MLRLFMATTNVFVNIFVFCVSVWMFEGCKHQYSISKQKLEGLEAEGEYEKMKIFYRHPAWSQQFKSFKVIEEIKKRKQPL